MWAMPRGITSLCLTGFIIQFLITLKCMAVMATNNNTTISNNKESSIKDDLATMRHIGHALRQCLSTSERWKCVEMHFTKMLDAVTEDNSTWRYGDYIVIEKFRNNRNTKSKGNAYVWEGRAQRQSSLHASNNGSGIAESLQRFLQSRAIRLHLPSSRKALQNIGAGISDVIDVLTLENIAPSALLYEPTEAAQADEGRQRALYGMVDDKLEQFLTKTAQNNIKKNKNEKTNKQKDNEQLKKIKYKDKDKYSNKFFHTNKVIEQKFINENSLKGRKKKNKDKNIAMMGGIAMIAMVAQMFLSKVILIAGAAFVMAKIALLVSVLGSLKKGSTGTSTSTDHIVVTDHGLSGHGGYGGHSVHGGDEHHTTSWHRSMPPTYHSKQAIAVQPAQHHEHNHKPPEIHMTSHNLLNQGYQIGEESYDNDGDEYRRRQTQNAFI